MSKFIFISSDHAGFELKEKIYQFLIKQKYSIKNLGPITNVSVDYPDFSKLLAIEIKKKPGSFGILFCGTGIGISMAANKHNGIRAALCYDVNSAKLARSHNDANILALGERVIDAEIAKECVDVFINTPFDGGRHSNRVKKIDLINKERFN